MLPAEAPVAIIGRQPPVPKGTGGCLWDGCLRRACLLAAGGVVGSSVREIRVTDWSAPLPAAWPIGPLCAGRAYRIREGTELRRLFQHNREVFRGMSERTV